MPPQNRGVDEVTTVDDLEEYQETAEERVAEAFADITTEVTSPNSSEIIVRDALPSLDLDENTNPSNTGAVDTSNDLWEVDAKTDDLTSYPADYGFYTLDDDSGLENKAAVLYGFRAVGNAPTTDVSPLATTITVENNNGANLAEYDIQGLANQETEAIILDDPYIIADNTIRTIITLTADADSNTFQLKPLIKVAEKTQKNFSESGPFASSYSSSI